jgi:hypothetical protein
MMLSGSPWGGPTLLLLQIIRNQNIYQHEGPERGTFMLGSLLIILRGADLRGLLLGAARQERASQDEGLASLDEGLASC